MESFLLVLLNFFEYGESRYKKMGKDIMYECAHCLIHGLLIHSKDKLNIMKDVRDILNSGIAAVEKKKRGE